VDDLRPTRSVKCSPNRSSCGHGPRLAHWLRPRTRGRRCSRPRRGHCGPSGVDALALVREAVGIREFLADGDDIVAITDDLLRDHEAGRIEDYVRANDCLLLAPLRYEQADRIALESATLSRCVGDIVGDGLSVAVGMR
jgi:hypothetical protein